jgi:NAD(P)-dependent dehydrogenase (short-subunit alcohol dehydrogenase family)
MSSTGPAAAPLAGKLVVVTGATSGIGRQIAIDAAAAGASVLLVGRDRARLDEATAAAQAQGTAAALELSITEEDAPARLLEAATATSETLDAIVHSAGVLLAGGFASSSLEDLDWQWQVNVRAPFALTQALLPRLGPRGSVIFISSNAAHMGLPGGAAYAATKGAIEALSRTLAVEHGASGVRFNCVAPGAVMTPMNERFRRDDPGVVDAISARAPLGRWGEPADISGLVLYLISDASSYVTGASFAIDGGATAA